MVFARVYSIMEVLSDAERQQHHYWVSEYGAANHVILQCTQVFATKPHKYRQFQMRAHASFVIPLEAYQPEHIHAKCIESGHRRRMQCRIGMR